VITTRASDTQPTSLGGGGRGLWVRMSRSATHHEGGTAGRESTVSQQVWKAVVCFLCSFHGS
jgi:hypothetical protein